MALAAAGGGGATAATTPLVMALAAASAGPAGGVVARAVALLSTAWTLLSTVTTAVGIHALFALERASAWTPGERAPV